MTQSTRIVLMYHDVYVNNSHETGFINNTAIKYKIYVNEFAKQVKTISEYMIINGLPIETVEFSFDDGGKSFISEIAPILEQYNLKGIFFVTTGFIGHEGFLNENDLRDLVKRGHRVGSHSHTHPERMDILNEEDLKDEWEMSNNILTSILGYSPKEASIPNGYSSKKVIKSMVNAGFTEIYTSTPTIKFFQYLEANVIGRYAITNNSTVKSILSIIESPHRRFLCNTRFQLLRILKFILGDKYLSIRSIMLR